MLPATIEWKDGRLLLLDQRQLPSRTEYVSCESAEETARAIENMTVRGAPAIGVAAAGGAAACRDAPHGGEPLLGHQAHGGALARERG